eukprot:gnl/MRDRNA2_/MRDRNA2_166919_c0_seq1.p1 gnl/MRDRNA2_/MRDRNA2_166919_c0~~gnl/MRDRNA2_/MRDRNA2_166919_c0_seq1.p1  ORF type:complete len:139 (-),score=19.55 gnl/MRDRNA2_/MRDRNA2_166919_c0_seq1:20-436(-)
MGVTASCRPGCCSDKREQPAEGATPSGTRPALVCIASNPPEEIDGDWVLLPGLINQRPAYQKQVAEKSMACQMYLLYSDREHWAIQDVLDSHHDHDAYAICEDNAPHPAMLKTTWQIVSDETEEFQDHPGISIFAKIV